MKVLFDEQIFSLQKYGGISRAYTEIYKGLTMKDNYQTVIATKFSNNVYLHDFYNEHPEHNTSGIINKSGFGTLFRSYNRLKSILKERVTKYDLFIPTYINPYFLKHIGNKPFIFTVHDMIPELFPEYQVHHEVITKYKKHCMEMASKIISISESTKNDIIKLYPHLRDKIEVVYLGYNLVDPNFTAGQNEIHQLGDYILFVGTRDLYKGFNFMVHSIAGIIREKNLKLVCVGGGGFTESEQKVFIDHDIADLCFQLTVTDKELNLYYASAKVFIFPSEYEGFGLPILEAYANNCPVLLANNSSLHEIGGDGALYFETNNIEDFASLFSKVIDSAEIRDEMIKKSQIRLKNFSWQKNVEDTIKVYQSVC